MPNETIDIFPGAFDNPILGGDPTWVEPQTVALVVQLSSQDLSDPEMEAFAIKVIGRLVGETMAHEIVHALLWEDIPTGHNPPPGVTNDLMNAGGDRSFRQRTGLEDTTHTSPLVPANFIDHGVASIGGLQAMNQGRMDSRFPVPPSFA